MLLSPLLFWGGRSDPTPAGTRRVLIYLDHGGSPPKTGTKMKLIGEAPYPLRHESKIGIDNVYKGQSDENGLVEIVAPYAQFYEARYPDGTGMKFYLPEGTDDININNCPEAAP